MSSRRRPLAPAPVRRTLSDVRAATTLASARPAYIAGLRAAIATTAPLLAAHFLHLTGGTWMSLAGFTGTLSDKGGPYRTRAATLAAVTGGEALAAVLGTLAAPQHIIAVPLTFFIALLCSLGRAYGNAGAGVGISVLNVYVIALAFPSSVPGEALVRAGFVMVGGLWAMLLALVLWPLRPYRPLRLAVAGAYRALGAYTDQLARWSAGAESLPIGAPVRSALEQARVALATVRRGRAGASGRGERLLVLREIADQLFGHLVGLTDLIEAIPPEKRIPAAQQALASTLAGASSTARAIADAIEAERGATRAPVFWNGAELRNGLPEMSATATAGDDVQGHYGQAAQLLDRHAQYARLSATTAAGLNEGRDPLTAATETATTDNAPAAIDPVHSANRSEAGGQADSVFGYEAAPIPPLAPLRAALAPGSITLRHALRLGLVTAAAVWITDLIHLQRGYWVTITSVIIMHPYTGLTTQRALQRVLGTIVGGVLTAGLAAVFHAPVAIFALVFVFSGLSVALLPLNYAVFSVFLTPTFVLLAEASTGDWHLAGIRIVNTLLGGVLALAGVRLLWPTRESARLPSYLAQVLRAEGGYMRLVAQRYSDRNVAAGRAIRSARRQVGMAILNAEESFQRLLGEHRGAPEELAPSMTLLTYARRLTASIAALALSRHSLDGIARGVLEPFAEAAGRVLEDLAHALETGRPPATMLEFPGWAGDHLPPMLTARVTRIILQIKTLHDAVARFAGSI